VNCRHSSFEPGRKKLCNLLVTLPRALRAFYRVVWSVLKQPAFRPNHYVLQMPFPTASKHVGGRNLSQRASVLFGLLGRITGILNLRENFTVNLEIEKGYFEDTVMQNSLAYKRTAGSKLME